MGPPSTCSGLAYCGVITNWPVTVASTVPGSCAPSSSFAMPSRAGEALRRRRHDVRRLDVAVHHQVLVRVLHRGADLAEEVDPGVDPEVEGVAVLVERRPSMCSMTRYGRPSSMVPPSSSARCRDGRGASIWRSARNRACRSERSAPPPSTLRATFVVGVVGEPRDTRCSCRLRRAWPHRYWPILRPTRVAGGGAAATARGPPEELVRLRRRRAAIRPRAHLHVLAADAGQEGPPAPRRERGRLVEEGLDVPPGASRHLGLLRAQAAIPARPGDAERRRTVPRRRRAPPRPRRAPGPRRTQLHDLRELSSTSELAQRLVNRHDLGVAPRRHVRHVVERTRCAPPPGLP